MTYKAWAILDCCGWPESGAGKENEKMNNDKLQAILESHREWLEEKGGERADLQEANLQGANLREANLQRADLRETDLLGANLQKANLWRADLWRADLQEANLQGANLWRANLQGANLQGANLQGVNLQGANLRGADLRETDLRGADLWGADLQGADLQGADLWGANLQRANLCEADLQRADLWRANLQRANLQRADLCGANLCGADLQGANLREAKNTNMVKWNHTTAFFAQQCPEKGAYIGYKKAQGLIVELEILRDALRSSATSRKCRASAARVLSITNIDGAPAEIEEVSSDYDSKFVYKIGGIVEVPDFCTDRWNECAPGIHHFITRDEAVLYE